MWLCYYVIQQIGLHKKVYLKSLVFIICCQIKVYVGQTQFYNSSVNEKNGSTRFVLLHVYNNYIVLM